ncbi:immunity protein TriTu family protein [Pectobacterium brasiliense]|uniref:immunity protein TriTu family protein n=1 Tax=Pectobacterium brasiliense TaxID=180957 RepID=UPI0032EDDC2D
MLIEIKNWILSNSTHQVEMNENEYTSSLVVDFENENKIARFTVWDDKSCMLEVMDVDTGKYIINERRELSETSEIIESFKEFNDFIN